MNGRNFSLVMALALTMSCGGLAGCLKKRSPQTEPLSETRQASPAVVRAIWLAHPDFLRKSEADIAALAERLKGLNFNTVYLSVYADGKPFWPSPAMTAAGGVTTNDNWADRVRRIFRERGFWVGAWFEYGLAVGTGDHPLFKAHKDEWFQQRKNGEYASSEEGNPGEHFVFLSPASKPVRDLLAEMGRELGRMGFDEIQLDRFRYARGAETGREYGYEAISKAYYEATTGRKVPDDINEPDWVNFRQDLVRDTVGTVTAAIKEINPKIVVSASPVGHYGIERHLQRWSAWLNAGYVDMVFPQVYASSFAAFSDHLARLKDYASANRLGGPRKFGIGIKVENAELTKQSLRHAWASGVYDYALWVYQNGKTAATADLDFLVQEPDLFQTPVRNPFWEFLWGNGK